MLIITNNYWPLALISLQQQFFFQKKYVIYTDTSESKKALFFIKDLTNVVNNLNHYM